MGAGASAAVYVADRLTWEIVDEPIRAGEKELPFGAHAMSSHLGTTVARDEAIGTVYFRAPIPKFPI